MSDTDRYHDPDRHYDPGLRQDTDLTLGPDPVVHADTDARIFTTESGATIPIAQLVEVPCAAGRRRWAYVAGPTVLGTWLAGEFELMEEVH